MDTEIIQKLEYLDAFANRQLNEFILPFWRTHAVDNEMGGFYGQINNDMEIIREAEKGLILNARILWTFSTVYRKQKNPRDLELAGRAYEYLCRNFFDAENGGYYWSLNADGSPRETKKQIYAQAFTIYGLSEYYKVTQDEDVLQKAKDLFHLIEEKSFDQEKNGYIEARNREWMPMDDIRLSERDMNVAKSMNTHLHVLEAYGNLYLVWKDPFLKKQLENLIHIFADIIIHPEDHHQQLFFDADWNSQSSLISFGHDIETSWLLHEAALISENRELIDRIIPLSISMSEKVKKGFAPSGALYYESDRQGKHHEKEIEWWPQAEGIVGYLNTYVLNGDESNVKIAHQLAQFIESHIVDKTHGEWFFRVTEDGVPILSHEKAGFWKCPYHNARACLEIMHRLELIHAKS
ncbi:MAG: AGE family epimerase/isomerase [Bacteroidales bacterium]|nr:AGE family epimerase/isomerase [Bacteroidales bacterium]